MVYIAWHPDFCHPLPENHRFPMLKYELIPEQLLHEGTIEKSQLFEPQLLPLADALLTHEKEYVYNLTNLLLNTHEIRRIGFPLSDALVKRELRIAQGTVTACQFALKYGIALNVAGGTHHAFTNKGEGFCMLNDQAIAANWLLKNQMAQRILIIDLDVHQGNGTAQIFAKNNNVFTFSMHGADNFPMHKEKSDLDIPLLSGTPDTFYLQELATVLSMLLENFKPDFCFYQAGVDVLATDKLGKLNLSKNGCKKRDELVLSACKQHHIPIVVCMGGGYSKDIKDILDAHCNTFRLAMHYFG